MPLSANALDDIRPIVFPTDATLTVEDNYGLERSGGRIHEGIDIMGPKLTPLYAAVDGRVRHLNIPEETWGYAIVLQDDEGYTYHYLHVNNDTPGTDDGEGGEENAYAPGIAEDVRVSKGQFIGWMGDSGNAESAGSHLHFEIRFGGEPINPYASLIAARYPGTYNRNEAGAASPTINDDRGLVGSGGQCVSGSLIKSQTNSTVYYCGADGKRYIFPNDRVYFTWYSDFSSVITITDAQLAALPLGGLVTYKPGSKMVKIESLPNVYAIEKGGVLRWIKTPAIAASLYGSDWAKKVDDVSDAIFGSYKIGEPISAIR
ncbi:M23 family metallopeptidase [Candidatus Uhrbacteria bacterium]|nr:M23 family metallopeptidase [Candidatus Uhrbacteria bacterium]